ncbi:hypothetical protein BDV96DRAFT_307773 [Lophiotrema nucula]|uniref:Uncharacterized protein n=1 Tax=Lophiotrema nucula TaxID=690887 RepID=A0A6A5YLK3_9PLEO|nr:hypothetical protein BDV96DRAFT_307773 [Lophiotrema nucula]
MPACRIWAAYNPHMLQWLEPSRDEVEQFKKDLFKTLARQSRYETVRAKFVYFPARFTQRLTMDLGDEMSQTLDSVDQFQGHPIINPYFDITRTAPAPGLDGDSVWPGSRDQFDGNLYWLDFSQFRINPYFEALLDNLGRTTRGRYEISLSTTESPHILFGSTATQRQGLLQYIGDMYLTQPPCTVVGLYHSRDNRFEDNDVRAADIRLIRRIHNPEGIRVGQILSALAHSVPEVLSNWRSRVDELEERVSNGHWTEDFWNVPNSPSITLLLDNVSMLSDSTDDRDWRHLVDNDEVGDLPDPPSLCAHVTRPAYLISTPFRDKRQEEWMPREMFEPMKSEIRGPINWNR